MKNVKVIAPFMRARKMWDSDICSADVININTAVRLTSVLIRLRYNRHHIISISPGILPIAHLRLQVWRTLPHDFKLQS